ncbi:DUF4145 domain-containing protein [Acinetobacter amyesii]|uniref:DUF4145 domain-containing protein n=1 Tax=Acinetobacter amyesii TaxID=2942470 RepID=UPI0020BF649C|nr:DUF4145 domain-containing protein [Acinetobacter amyesii]MCL6240138.1 DUF4145 domain-containing protein [Acinetobacter amyesii]
MHIWKNCWQCKHETPQNRLSYVIHPKPVEGFSKDKNTHKATQFWLLHIDAYQFTQCQKCGAPSLHIDSLQIKNINENLINEIRHEIEENGKYNSEAVSSISYPNFGKSLISEKKWSYNLPPEDMLLFFEILSAYEKELYTLALSGIRTLVDRYIVRKVGDAGTFAQKLKKMLENNHISSKQYEVLNTIIDGGNAASHRGFNPGQQMVKAFLESIEDIISLYFKTEQIDELKKQIPQRPRK